MSTTSTGASTSRGLEPISRRATMALVALAAIAPAPGTAQDEYGMQIVVEGFTEGWESRWRPVSLGRPQTVYEVIEEEDGAVLRASSTEAASALLRPLSLDKPTGQSLAWRWKVERSLRNDRDERAREGDDYAARLFVVYGSRGTLEDAICYVWAASEPAGSVYPSPYVSSVATIVLRSGDEQAGEWVTEERDVEADYRSFFGRDPGAPTAIALMVDTDDTGTSARAWFDDIWLQLRLARP